MIKIFLFFLILSVFFSCSNYSIKVNQDNELPVFEFYNGSNKKKFKILSCEVRDQNNKVVWKTDSFGFGEKGYSGVKLNNVVFGRSPVGHEVVVEPGRLIKNNMYKFKFTYSGRRPNWREIEFTYR